MKKIFPIIALLCVMIIAGFIYADGYQYPSCCDTAVSLVKAKVIAQHGIIGSTLPFNPTDHEPLYSSIISSESLVHLILAIIYKIHGEFSYNLVFAKYFFLILFISTGFGIYLITQKILKSNLAAVVAVLFTLFSFWYGNMYWSGHVAQMLGILILSFFLFCLLHYQEKRKNRDLFFAALLLILIFFTHVLTFLIALLIFITYSFIVIYRYLRKKIFVVLFYGFFMMIVLLFFTLMPRDSNLLPNFQVTDLGNKIQQLFKNTIGQSIFLVLFTIGVFFAIRKRNSLLIIFFLSTFFLSQSSSLLIPFYSYRFNEFIVVPIIIIAIYGLWSVINNSKSKLISIVLCTSCILILVPFGISQQLEIRKCYIKNCEDLNPTQISDKEVDVLKWVRSNLPAQSVFTSPKKFGYFIPIITDNRVEFPDGEKEQIFINDNSSERHRIAKQYHIRYILWGDIFKQMKRPILEIENYTKTSFENANYFKLIYNLNNIEIYEVL